jgi:hypothetical protein
VPVRGRFTTAVVVEVTGPPCGPTGTDVAVATEVPPGRLDVVSEELVGAVVAVPPGGVVEPSPVTGVVAVVEVDAVVVGAVVDVEHDTWVVVVVPAGSDVVEPSPVTGVVAVVVVDAVVVGAVVDVEHASVVGGTTVVDVVDAVVVLTCVDAGATVVVVDESVEVDTVVVDVEVGTPVAGGTDVGGGVEDVLGACVVDDVDEVPVVQLESSSTDVLSVSVKWSGHIACTVSVIVPLVAPGTMVVANVVPFSETGLAYPATGYVCALIVATAVSIVIASVVSLLPIDQSTR